MRSQKQKQHIEETPSDESIALQLNESDSDHNISDEEIQVNIWDHVIVEVGRCINFKNY